VTTRIANSSDEPCAWVIDLAVGREVRKQGIVDQRLTVAVRDVELSCSDAEQQRAVLPIERFNVIGGRDTRKRRDR
jgi:hypothetical protein